MTRLANTVAAAALTLAFGAKAQADVVYNPERDQFSYAAKDVCIDPSALANIAKKPYGEIELMNLPTLKMSLLLSAGVAFNTGSAAKDPSGFSRMMAASNFLKTGNAATPLANGDLVPTLCLVDKNLAPSDLKDKGAVMIDLRTYLAANNDSLKADMVKNAIIQTAVSRGLSPNR